MSSGISLAFAFEAVAALVLCALKVVISIPESFKTWDCVSGHCFVWLYEAYKQLFLTVRQRLGV